MTRIKLIAPTDQEVEEAKNRLISLLNSKTTIYFVLRDYNNIEGSRFFQAYIINQDRLEYLNGDILHATWNATWNAPDNKFLDYFNNPAYGHEMRERTFRVFGDHHDFMQAICYALDVDYTKILARAELV